MTPTEKMEYAELLNELREEKIAHDYFERLCENQGVQYGLDDPWKQFFAVLKHDDYEKVAIAKQMLKK